LMTEHRWLYSPPCLPPDFIVCDLFVCGRDKESDSEFLKDCQGIPGLG